MHDTQSEAATMKAAVVHVQDAAFEIVEMPRPVPADHELLVRITASGLNPLDAKIRAAAAPHARHEMPAIIGLDMAGTVEVVGRKVSGFSVGDQVYGMVGGVGGLQGTLAEYVAADAALLAHRPQRLTAREAAALPLVFITAWEGLVDRARVQSGQRVLVHGGAGGVGHVAIQIAIAHGARTWATGSAEQRATIERFGAVFVDRDDVVERYVESATGGVGFDIVVDTVGGAVLDLSFKAVRTYSGHVVSSLGWGTHALAPLSFRAASYSGVFALLPLLTGHGRAHHGRILEEASRLVDAGKLVLSVDPTNFAMADADAAHLHMTSRAAIGKVVVEIEPRPPSA